MTRSGVVRDELTERVGHKFGTSGDSHFINYTSFFFDRPGLEECRKDRRRCARLGSDLSTKVHKSWSHDVTSAGICMATV